MRGESISRLEPKTHMALGGLHLFVGAATAPRANVRAMAVVRVIAPDLLADVRELARTDLSAIEDADQLTQLLQRYREIATFLERLLEIQQTRPRRRLVELLGTPAQIESVLEAIEEKIEDLEIATSPEVHTGLERLIAEVTSL
jgi:alkanesulfonate monooxygenase SsuD/methylene tetrahydromethanopterin reductase-like flavin-dependent oxidoreductase (luciferase family)